jgi:hypothetical protein
MSIQQSSLMQFHSLNHQQRFGSTVSMDWIQCTATSLWSIHSLLFFDCQAFSLLHIFIADHNAFCSFLAAPLSLKFDGSDSDASDSAAGAYSASHIRVGRVHAGSWARIEGEANGGD